MLGGHVTILPMPELVPPTTAVHRSFLEALEESAADPMYLLGARFTNWRVDLADPDRFATYVTELRADALEDTPRPDGYVPATVLWYVDGETFLGRLSIRHRLNAQLLELGGHIGYGVRPSARRRGHATAMLRAALPVARRLGIDPALVTCDFDNVGSRKVIETVIAETGGYFEDRRQVKLRYWVSTSGG
jgi:predicted acetyltransferase